MNMKDFGKRIAYFRKKKGLKQEIVAKKLNVTRQTLSAWECDKTEPDFDTFLKLCEILGVSTSEFFGEENSKEDINNDLMKSNNESECQPLKDKKQKRQKPVDTKYNIVRPHSVFKVSLWTTLTSVFTILLIGIFIGSHYAFEFSKTINDFFGLPTYEKYENLEDEDEDLEYYKSEFKNLSAVEEEAKRLALQEQREGATLLWNHNNSFPIGKKKVSLFGVSSFSYAPSGYGSGSAGNKTPLKTALENAGLSVNGELWNLYANASDCWGADHYGGTGKTYYVKEMEWNRVNAVSSSFDDYSDAAIYVISRRTGELAWNNDTPTGYDHYGGEHYGGSLDWSRIESGDYFDLTIEEIENIQNLVELRKNGTFKKLVVLVNTAEGISFYNLTKYRDNIDACLWIGQGGNYGTIEVGKIIAGDSIPSGHLPDTFVYSGISAPATINHEYLTYENKSGRDWGDTEKTGSRGYFMGHYTVYAENIYVGYKYYETRYEDYVLGQGNANGKAGVIHSKNGWNYNEEVAYPFGYGLAYTTFDYGTPTFIKNDDGSYTAKVTVTNEGEKAGQDAVQVYVQRPYTDYDKQYNIENASVNLAGFKKTKMLQPGDSETVEIKIEPDAFKVYDAYNRRTYIREAGTHYISIAQDSHEAINNILAAKGKTTADGMDKNGNVNLVKKVEFTENDYTTFSTSSTGTKITNLFDECDWNLYKNKDNTNITYLSRNDWNGTYPKPVKLTVNVAMYDDLDWNKEYAANPEDKMPTYGAENGLTLINLRGKEYDDPAWDELLDQMTLDEQIELLATAYHGTAAVGSIGKPAENVGDGPLGRPKVFTATSLLAATFNEKLSEEVGKLMGEYGLYKGIHGLYAPGANMHRSMYGGRGFEYYSEDTFLSSRMLATQVRGIQSKGVYVNVKHFVLNDQDCARKGISTWCNEQALREIYIETFRSAVEDENCTGVMSAFNRIGTKWCGALTALNDGLLRGEWGFKGFVISDCPWQAYMGTVDGLFGGNDCILYAKVDRTQYAKAKDNATIALKIRESTKRILYVVVNSHVMNGISNSTLIIPITSWWWSKSLVALQIGFSILSLGSAVMLIISLIKRKSYKKACNEKGLTIKEYETYWKENVYIKPEPVKLGKLLIPYNLFKTIIIILLIIATAGLSLLTVVAVGEIRSALHECDDRCLICNLCTTNCEERNCEDKCAGHTFAEIGGDTYVFEAEDAMLVQEGNIAKIGKEKADTTSPSGDKYIYNLSKAASGTYVNFRIHSEKRAAVGLIIRLGHSATESLLSDVFKIHVNNERVRGIDDIFIDKYDSNTEVKYYAWRDTEIAIITLEEGVNEIKFTKTDICYNFDCIKLVSASKLSWAGECQEHTYSPYNVELVPTETTKGRATRECSVCGHKDTIDLPELSENNGYTKEITKAATIDKTGEITWKQTINGQEFVFVTIIPKLPNPDEKTLKIEAETCELANGVTAKSEKNSNNPSGGSYVGRKTTTEGTITFKVTAQKDCNAKFVLCYGNRTNDSTSQKFNDKFVLTVNGEEQTSQAVFNKATENNYFAWEEYEICEIQLKAGENVFVLKYKPISSSNVDYIKLLSNEDLTLVNS